MSLLFLQRQLLVQKKLLQRSFCLLLAAVTFCSALLLQVQISGRQSIAADPASSRYELPNKSSEEITGPELRYQPNEEELELLARAVYSEARGEKFDGQVAVAAVILNRIDDSKFPDDVAGVIFQPMAFTAVADGQFWLEPNQTAYRAVEKALEGKDPSFGALYYYNPAKATSWWIFTRPIITRIGRHVFAE